MIVEVEDGAPRTRRTVPKPHTLCTLLRQLRLAAGLSLTQFQERYGIPAVVVGAYERGDRVPPLAKLDSIFRCYGYELIAVPVDTNAVQRIPDMVTTLRVIANQLENAENGTAVLPGLGESYIIAELEPLTDETL